MITSIGLALFFGGFIGAMTADFLAGWRYRRINGYTRAGKLANRT